MDWKIFGTAFITLFLAELGDPFARIGADTTGRAALDWGVYGLPETFVIGRDGKIRKKVIGADNWNSPANRAVLAQLLGVPAPGMPDSLGVPAGDTTATRPVGAGR